MLLELLKEAAAAHEKLLLFSQSLVVLELIEQILAKSGRWKVSIIMLWCCSCTVTMEHELTITEVLAGSSGEIISN